jgi:hypothetical protein
MKRMVLLFALLFLSSTVLMADTIDYGTSGLFTGSATLITFGSGPDTSTISFDGVGSSSVTAPSYISLGSFKTSSTGNGAMLSGNYTFDLTVTQSFPTSGSGTLDSTVLDGTLSETSSGIAVDFTTSNIVINGVTYSLVNNPIALVPPSTGGVSTIEAYVTPAPVSAPEPGSMALLSSGLFFFGFVGKRKLKLF